ncbi:type II toxin-antitoxin system death-on-curing family toxin [Chloroflexia bacterium SDU3-3]|nr:type II toxin-antitoxin system death-on-curing family toxin [Chloroflexia bacterium SDU3-3]
MNYLHLGDLMAIRHRVAKESVNSCAVREMSSLMAAISAPQQVVFGQEIFGSLEEKAGALLHSLVVFHPFWDGNKRIATLALRLFLQRNGARLTATDDALRQYAREIARGAISREDVTAWLADQIEDSA